MVSFTFDDAPVSAATRGAGMLEEYDARGTFYISGGLVDSWSGNWTNCTAAATRSPATLSRTRAPRTCPRLRWRPS
jgi:peptidoglycan/xylan/chitin deacetylase (PgdA/CDA1 family)